MGLMIFCARATHMGSSVWSIWFLWFFWMNFRSHQPDRPDLPDRPASRLTRLAVHHPGLMDRQLNAPMTAPTESASQSCQLDSRNGTKN